MWYDIKEGIINFVKSLNDDDIKISIFNFDSQCNTSHYYRSPSEILNIISDGFDANSGSKANFNVCMKEFLNIFEVKDAKLYADWLNYIILFTPEMGRFEPKNANDLIN